MKKRKILMSMLLVASMMVSLIGCSSSSDTETTEVETTEVETEVEEEETKVLKVGMECMNAPYNWTQTDDSNGAVQIAGTSEYVNGYDVMIAKAIAEEGGYELEIYKIEWDGLIMAVQSGTIDVIIAGMSATEERKESVDFSESYYEAKHVLIVQADSEYASATSLDDLAGASATSQQGTTMYDVSLDQITDVDKLEAVSDIPSLIVAVDSGRADVGIVEKPMAIAAMATNSTLTMVEFEDGSGFDVEEGITNISAAVAKDNTELLEICNAAISSLTDEDKDALMQESIDIQPASE